MTVTFSVPGYRVTVVCQSDGTVVVTIEPIEPMRSRFRAALPSRPARLQFKTCKY